MQDISYKQLMQPAIIENTFKNLQMHQLVSYFFPVHEGMTHLFVALSYFFRGMFLSPVRVRGGRLSLVFKAFASCLIYIPLLVPLFHVSGLSKTRAQTTGVVLCVQHKLINYMLAAVLSAWVWDLLTVKITTSTPGDQTSWVKIKNKKGKKKDSFEEWFPSIILSPVMN